MSHQTEDRRNSRPWQQRRTRGCVETVPALHRPRDVKQHHAAGSRVRPHDGLLASIVRISDDLASLRAQVQALQQELQCNPALKRKRRTPSPSTGQVREMETVWQNMLKHKRGAEAAAAEIAHLQAALADVRSFTEATMITFRKLLRAGNQPHVRSISH
jgi:cytochrome c556